MSFAKDIGPIITFRHRLREHFGVKDMTFLQFLDRVHPLWAPYYEGVGSVVYQIAADHPDWATTPEACY
ncbi:MAG: hypothetical protein AAF597_00905, partial [Bacteroidota bacterium]